MQVILAQRAAQAKRLTAKYPDAVILHPSWLTIWRSGVAVTLTPRRFNTVFAIAAHAGGLASSDDIFDALYGDDPDGGPEHFRKCVESFLWAARKELPALGLRIETEHGRGFRLAVDPMPVARQARRAA